MKKSTIHSRSGLFLMEMILSILILALTSAICIRIFAQAKTYREEARTWNHIEELTISAGEILEGTDGSSEAFLELMPGGILSENQLIYFYDTQWNLCKEEDVFCRFLVRLSEDSRSRQAILTFQNARGNILYEQTVRFPLFGIQKEAH